MNFLKLRLSSRFGLLFLLPLLGCTGVDVPPHIFKGPPYTLLRGSEQIGRDQLMNRLLVANQKISIKGVVSNDVLTLLGQPQQIEQLDRGVSEDWIYVYYKQYTPKHRSDPSEFMVRMYRGKVLDVIKDI